MAKKSYLLNHDDPELIRACIIKAYIENKTLKQIIMEFLREYVKGGE